MDEEHVYINDFDRELSKSNYIYTKLLKQKLIYFLIIVCVAICILKIPKTFWLIPSHFSNEKLNPYTEPVMIMIPENIQATNLKKPEDYFKLEQIKSLKNRKIYYILPLAEYSITARIKAKNRFFYNQSVFDKVALIDYGFAFGDMAKDEYFSKIYSYSREQLSGARSLLISFEKKYYKELKDKNKYLWHHTSHTHVIPANRKIMKALKATKYGQTIKLEG